MKAKRLPQTFKTLFQSFNKRNLVAPKINLKKTTDKSILIVLLSMHTDILHYYFFQIFCNHNVLTL